MKKLSGLVRRKFEEKQKGQAMLIIAAGFVALVAFVGFAVDAGILFANIGHLRRAVDTAALSSANQFREGQDTTDIMRSARELIILNLPDLDIAVGSTEVIVYTCDGPPSDAALCTTPPRKLVRVEANTLVEFAFMPVIGIDSTRISADAISEAASLDLILVIDTSTSMTYDDSCGNGVDDDPEDDGVGNETIDDGCGANPVVGAVGENELYADPVVCNPINACHPFEEVRQAALSLLDSMYYPYDRVALVTFDAVGLIQSDLDNCASLATPLLQKTCLQTQLNAMQVLEEYPPVGHVGTSCTQYSSNGDPRGCMQTNTGYGLWLAAQEYYARARPESVLVTVFLSDGVANAANNVLAPADVEDWYCPGDTWNNLPDKNNFDLTYLQTHDPTGPPFCNDGDTGTRHAVAAAAYDADDFARDQADVLGCRDTLLYDATDADDNCPAAGAGAVIFSVGLGGSLTNHPFAVPARGMNPDVGEQLLRYVANVGFNNKSSVGANDLCSGAAVGANCGNYYYAATGADLQPIFDAISSRIFTRLTH